MFDWTRIDTVTEANPLRVLFSSCILGNPTGWDGGPYTEPLAVRLAALPNVKPVHFCPENAFLGTPRPLTTLHDGHGRDVLAGRARVLETTGRDVTRQIVLGGQAMREIAQHAQVELAIMLDVSDSCGSRAVYLGEPAERRYQQGPGVAAAILMQAGIPIIAQRDYASMNRLLAALDPTFVPDGAAKDFVDHPWFVDYFKDGPVGLPMAEYEANKQLG